MKKKSGFIGTLLLALGVFIVIFPLSADSTQKELPQTVSEIPEEYIFEEEEKYNPDEISEEELGEPLDPVELILTDEEYEQLLEVTPEGAILIEEFKRVGQ